MVQAVMDKFTMVEAIMDNFTRVQAEMDKFILVAVAAIAGSKILPAVRLPSSSPSNPI